MADRETTGLQEVARLPNGCTLYREPNEVGGHRYWSDEVGGGVVVWDTCLVGQDTLLAAIVEEQRRMTEERHGKVEEQRRMTEERHGKR